MVVENRLIILEDFLVLLLGLGCPRLRWMFSEPDLFLCIESSSMDFRCVHLFQFSMSATKMSPFQILPRKRHNRGILLVRLSCRTDCSRDRSLAEIKGDIRSSNQMELLVPSMVRRIAVREELSHHTRDLLWFADSSNIPWNPRTIFHPDLIATIQQKSLLQLCVPFQQSHLSLNGEVLTCNDSKIDLHRLCQIPRNCRCKWLLVSSSAPRTFVSSFLFPEKFWFCTDMIESIELPNLVPRQRIDECLQIHIH